MRKFLKLLPSLTFMLASLVIGILMSAYLGGGFQVRSLVVGLIIGLFVIVMATAYRYEPETTQDTNSR